MGNRASRFLVLFAFLPLVLSQAEAQSLQTFDDKAAFLAATAATGGTGPLPDLGLVDSATVGSVTFSPAPGGGPLYIGANGNPTAAPDWYAPTPGNDIALGIENLQVQAAAPIHSFGFEMVEPNATMPIHGGVPVDSTFTLTLFSGVTEVGEFVFNVPDDEVAFIGVWNDLAFDRAWLIETTGDDDDEYFGEFYTGITAPASATAPGIVLYSNPATGAGWDVDTLLATDPYDYPTTAGKLRDAVERYLLDGIQRMTGRTVPITNSSDLENPPANSILIVLFADAPASIQGDAAIQAALNRSGGNTPDYVADRESYYIKSDGSRTWIIANTVDGIVSAMPTLLGSKGYDILGLGPNWTYAPDFRGKDLSFDLNQGYRNNGYYVRTVGGFGGGGEATLVVEFDLTPPDEDVTKSYSRWRVGTRMNAATSVPAFTGDALDSYADAVLQYMRDHPDVNDGFLTANTVHGLGAERPAAGPDTEDWLWIDTDDLDAFYSRDGSWKLVESQVVGFSINLSTEWARQVILEIMKAQANSDAWNTPDEWSVFAAQPEDGPGYERFADYVHNTNWYPEYRTAEGQTWGSFVLHGYRGIDQPLESWDGTAVSDTVFGFGNWLLREYDHWVDTLPEGNQVEEGTPTQRTRTGKDRKALIRAGISSYNFNDVPPHFNLDPRIRVIVGGFPKNRGGAQWPTIVSHEDVAGAMQLMLPDEPIANYALVDDWGWDPVGMSHVLPHRWGNSSQSILDMYQSFTDVGVRSWAAEMEMGYTQHSLGLYLISKYMWDPTLTKPQMDLIRDEWLLHAFGPTGWEKMKEYFDWCEPGTAVDVPNFWGKAIDLLSEADALIPDDSDYQRRLDDVKQHWYFYYLMDTDQLVSTNANAAELLWKGQSAFTITPYLLAWYVFGGQWLMERPQLFSPVNYTTGPAHYTPDEVAEWWALVDEHWPYTEVTAWKDLVLDDGTPASTVDLNDLVSVNEFRNYEPESSEVLNYSAYDYPGTQAFLVSRHVGEDIGFKLLWTAYDPPQSQGYWGPHRTSFEIDHWDTAQKAWIRETSGVQPSVAVAAADNYTAANAWLAEVHHSAELVGTYRITIGRGGVGFLGNVAWDITQPPHPLADNNGPSFNQLVLFDAQPDGDGMYVYIPKGVQSLDFEMIDPDETFEKTLTLYQGLPLTEATATRVVDVTARGTHRIELRAGESGTLAKFKLGVSAFEVPYLYSIPQIWARSPSALLVPRAVAVADGLTSGSQPVEVRILEGAVSDDSPDVNQVQLAASAGLDVIYSLGSGRRAGCQVTLTIIKPDASELGPFVLGSQEQTTHVPGADAGTWTFTLSGSGGCAGQSYRVEVRAFASVVGAGLGLVLLGLALATISGLAARRLLNRIERKRGD